MLTRKFRYQKVLSTLFVAFIALALLTGCVGAKPAAAPTATDVPPTNTPEPTNTPVPTDTPEPTSTPTKIPTKTPTATADLKATEAVKATANAEKALAQVKADLKPYEDISIEKGSLAWASTGSEDIKLSGYNEAKYNMIGDGLKVKNFIFKVDITWESTSGLAVCGVILRSSGPDINSANHYQFRTLRLAGIPEWSITYYSGTDSYLNLSFNTSNAIDQKNGATNTYVLVANGDNFTMYGNGKKLGVGKSDKQPSGQLGYIAVHESGTTSCSYSNAWVWELPDK